MTRAQSSHLSLLIKIMSFSAIWTFWSSSLMAKHITLYPPHDIKATIQPRVLPEMEIEDEEDYEEDYEDWDKDEDDED